MPNATAKQAVTARKPNRPFPPTSLEEAVKLAETIKDYNAGQPFDRLLLADRLGIKPSSSNFRDILKAAYQYGLTNGSEKSEKISLTQLGEKLTKPTNQGERIQAVVLAALSPEIAEKVYKHYNRNKWPPKEFLKNSLERQFSVSPEWSQGVAEGLEANARFAGIRNISGSEMVMLDAPPAPAELPEVGTVEQTPPEPEPPLPSARGEAGTSATEPAPQVGKPTHIFLGHGRNKKPLEQLKNILNQFKITYRVAVEEASRGLPIPDKVADLMKQCSSGILIFTRDEHFLDKDGNDVWRPSENVIHELGACGVLYGGRIIILKEKGITLPSNFSSIGYIEFETDALEAKGIDLLRELIAFGLVKVTAST